MKKLLIIEDSAAIAQALKSFLESSEYEVVTAGDGEQGFELFQTEKPDLIILDIELPKMSGYEVCRKIRREEYNEVPIIMMTGKKDDVDRIVGRVRGADAYITKPFEPQELIDQIKALLN